MKKKIILSVLMPLVIALSLVLTFSFLSNESENKVQIGGAYDSSAYENSYFGVKYDLPAYFSFVPYSVVSSDKGYTLSDDLMGFPYNEFDGYDEYIDSSSVNVSTSATIETRFIPSVSAQKSETELLKLISQKEKISSASSVSEIYKKSVANKEFFAVDLSCRKDDVEYSKTIAITEKDNSYFLIVTQTSEFDDIDSAEYLELFQPLY